MPKDLRHFLSIVRKLGKDYYVETGKPIKPDHEVSVLTHKLALEGRNPVIYCPEVEGSSLPLVTNVMGSYDLLGLALDIPIEDLGPRRRRKVREEYARRLAHFRSPVAVPSAGAPVHEVVLKGKQADLGRLPIPVHAPLNSGKYVSIGMTVFRDPETGIPNVGIYRHEVKGPDKLACRIVGMHHGNVIARKYAALKRPMETVVFIGHHPAVAMAAGAPRPSKMGESEFDLMGTLLGEPIEVTRGVTVDLPVPAWAEIAIEGLIDPNVMEREGPFCEAAGYYGEGSPCFVIDVTAITMRHDAIYQDLYPIHAEHTLVGILQRETAIYDAVGRQLPVRAVHLGPDDQCGKVMAYISIAKKSEDDGRAAGMAALAADVSRIAIVVDDDVDVTDEREVLWAVATRLNGVHMESYGGEWAASSKTPAIYSKKAGDATATDRKVVLDATRPRARPFPTRVVPAADVWSRVRVEDYLK